MISLTGAGAVVALLLAASGAAPDAGTADAGVERLHLKVGVSGSTPFVTDETPPDGFSVQTFEAVAARANVDFEAVVVATVDEGLAQLERGELDVLVGPVSITAERSRRVAFTQPYFHGGLGIVAPARGPSAFERVRPFFARAFLVAVLGLLVILAGVGALVWFFERRGNNPQFPQRPMPGIGAGVWFALVTMTTVGYGDKAPITTGGRVVSGVWMLIAMITASSLTAGIATGLTLSQIDRPALSSANELSGRSVAALRGTLAVDFARSYGARVTQVDDAEAALAALSRGDVEAVVADRPVLSYLLSGGGWKDLALSEGVYERRGYGFVLARGAPALERLDTALLEMLEQGRVEKLRVRWLGE